MNPSQFVIRTFSEKWAGIELGIQGPVRLQPRQGLSSSSGQSSEIPADDHFALRPFLERDDLRGPDRDLVFGIKVGVKCPI